MGRGVVSVEAIDVELGQLKHIGNMDVDFCLKVASLRAVIDLTLQIRWQVQGQWLAALNCHVSFRPGPGWGPRLKHVAPNPRRRRLLGRCKPTFSG